MSTERKTWEEFYWEVVHEKGPISRFDANKIADQLFSAQEIHHAMESLWIPVSEHPPSHKNLICLNADGRVFKGRICYGFHEPFYTYPDGDKSASDTCPSWINVTHWMLMPPIPPPSNQSDNGKD